MEPELSVEDIKSLTSIQRNIESKYADLRREAQKRELEENTRHGVAMGEIRKWFNEENTKLNQEVKDLNAASAGLMPVHPRR